MPVTQRGAAGGIQMNKRDKARAMARVGGFYFGLLAAGAALILVASSAVAQTIDEAMALSVRDHPAVKAQNLEVDAADRDVDAAVSGRSEEHTSELQSLMRISYAGFCL